MKNLALIALALIGLTACGGKDAAATDRDKARPGIEATSDAPQYTRQDVPGSIEGREVAEVSLDEMRPSFTGERVVRLNAIVRRSLDAANEYARDVKDIRSAADAAAADEENKEARAEAEAGLARLRAWLETAKAAKADMDAEAAELRASNESYSEELLAGMEKYVADIEKALTREIETISAKLSGVEQ